jgi:hypothetical protein
MEMGSIEDAAVCRVEISKEQAQANDPVRDIRHRDDEFARVSERWDGLPQYCCGIAQMLQNIREQDVIELLAIRKRESFDISQVKNVVIGPRLFCRSRIAFDSSYVMTSFAQDFSEIARGTADIENAKGLRFLFQYSQNPVMATVFEILERVAIL